MYLSIFNAFLFLSLFYSFFKRSYNNHLQRRALQNNTSTRSSSPTYCSLKNGSIKSSE
jgi:hypothetical protein